MSKFANYTFAQLKWASTDIKETLDIWKNEGNTSYVQEKQAELDLIREEIMQRQDLDIKEVRDDLINKGIDGLIASMMAGWMVREGLSLQAARSRADFIYWGD
jgi:hypothetical protein